MFESIACFGLPMRHPRVYFLLSLAATCQVCTVSLKAGQSTYKPLAPDAESGPQGPAVRPSGAGEAWPFGLTPVSWILEDSS